MTTFWKGHGTGNDFVIVDQQDPLTSAQVRWLCHRRFGIGADGTLQALRAGDVEDWNGDPDLWFICLLYTSPSPRDVEESRMPSSA